VSLYTQMIQLVVVLIIQYKCVSFVKPGFQRQRSLLSARAVIKKMYPALFLVLFYPISLYPDPHLLIIRAGRPQGCFRFMAR
jgi:hypothetical protein